MKLFMHSEVAEKNSCVKQIWKIEDITYKSLFIIEENNNNLSNYLN